MFLTVTCAINFQVAICELPFSPISTESTGGLGGTYDLLLHLSCFLGREFISKISNVVLMLAIHRTWIVMFWEESPGMFVVANVLTFTFWQLRVARMCAQEDSDVWIGLPRGVSGQLVFFQLFSAG